MRNTRIQKLCIVLIFLMMSISFSYAEVIPFKVNGDGMLEPNPETINDLDPKTRQNINELMDYAAKNNLDKSVIEYTRNIYNQGIRTLILYDKDGTEKLKIPSGVEFSYVGNQIKLSGCIGKL